LERTIFWIVSAARRPFVTLFGPPLPVAAEIANVTLNAATDSDLPPTLSVRFGA